MACYGSERSLLLIFNSRDGLVKVSLKSDALKCQNQVILLTLTKWEPSPFVNKNQEMLSKKSSNLDKAFLPVRKLSKYIQTLGLGLSFGLWTYYSFEIYGKSCPEKVLVSVLGNLVFETFSI